MSIFKNIKDNKDALRKNEFINQRPEEKLGPGQYKESEEIYREQKDERIMRSQNRQRSLDERESKGKLERRFLGTLRMHIKQLSAKGLLKGEGMDKLYQVQSKNFRGWKKRKQDEGVLEVTRRQTKNSLITVYDERFGHGFNTGIQGAGNVNTEELIEEVLAYDFSRAMLNKHWLGDNGATFGRMIKRTDILKNRLGDDQNYLNSLPKTVRELIQEKCTQAEQLFLEIRGQMAQRGVTLSLETGYVVKEYSQRQQDKDRQDGKFRSAEDHMDLFKKSRLREQKLTTAFSKEEVFSEQALSSLTFEDFTLMLGRTNRGQVTFKDGRLKVINDGKFCMKKGSATEENRLLRERFYKLALAQVGGLEIAGFVPWLRKLLNLDNEKSASMPLSRVQIRDAIQEINRVHSKVERALTNSKGVEEDMHFKIAQKVSGKLAGMPRSADDRAALRQQIHNLLETARGIGVDGDDLSNHEMESLLNGNIELVRDNLFDTLERLDNMVLNLSGEEEHTPEWFDDDALITRLAALEIRKVVQRIRGGSEELSQAADEITRNTVDRAFTITGKQGVRTHMESLYIPELSHAGDFGFYEEIEERRAQIGEERYSSPAFRKSLHEFAAILDRMQRIAEVSQNFIYKTGSKELTGVEELPVLGNLVDEALKQPQGLQEIAQILQGTRFETGLNRAIEKYQSGFRFQAAGEQLLENIPKKRQDRQKLIDMYEPPLEDALRKTELSDEDQATLASLSAEERAIADVLLMKLSPVTLIKKHGKDAASAISELQKILRSYDIGKPFLTSIRIGGGYLRLEKKRNDALVISSGSKKVVLPNSAFRIADFIEGDIVDNYESYGKTTAVKLFDFQKDPQKYEYQRQRELCVRFLTKYTGERSSAFTNAPVEKLREYVLSIANATIKSSAVRGVLQDLRELENDYKYAFTEEELRRNMTESGLRYREIGSVKIIPKEKKREADAPAWTGDEEAVKNFIADLVFGLGTYDYDVETDGIARAKSAKNRGVRLCRIMRGHRHALILLSKDETLMDQVMDKMALPEIEDEEQEPGKKPLKERIKSNVRLILNDPDVKEEMEKQRDESRSASNRAVSFNDFMGHKEDTGDLEKVERQIDQDIAEIAASMQKQLAKTVEDVFKTEEAHADLGPVPADPYEQGISPQVKEERIRARGKYLDKMLEEESKSSKGQGKFLKTVLSEYFGRASLPEQRAMVASMLRNSAPKKDTKGLSPEEIEKVKRREKGAALGGFLKGAGPLLHKLLQGMPEQGMPEEMVIALSDVKSNLTPITEDIIKRRLSDVVSRSGGEIDRIEVVTSLGAASVGQALLCRIYGPGIPLDGEEVVIKLLRPEARNRMLKEKDNILQSADKADPTGAMRKTYEGQIAKIEEEFDLSTEQKNVRLGQIYDRGKTTVKTVGLTNLVAGNPNLIAMKKAPGVTVDKFMKQTTALREKVLSSMYQYNDKNEVLTDPETNRPVLKCKANDSASIQKARRALLKRLHELEKRQVFLTDAAEKWVQEGIYGEGFYHGDLHAGNIMISDEQATIIDFGNAIKLTADQQKQITRLSAAAAVSKVGDFMDAFRALLPAASRERFDRQKPELTRQITEIFNAGCMESSGQMISLALLKAQGLGIEVPASINSFSQSQVRLQNTIDAFNNQILSIRQDLRELDELQDDDPVFDIVQSVLYSSNKGEVSRDDMLKKTYEIISPEAYLPTLKNLLRQNTNEARNTINEDLRDRFTIRTKERDEYLLKLSEFFKAQDRPIEELAPLENEVLAAYTKAFLAQRKESEIHGLLQEKLLMGEETLEWIREELSDWFEDTENHGTELANAFEALKITIENKESEEEIKGAADYFIDIYLDAAEKRFSDLISHRSKPQTKPKTFFAVMGEVLQNNIGASLKRLNPYRAYKYRSEINRRNPADPAEEEAQRNRLRAEEESRQKEAESVELHNMRVTVEEGMPKQLPGSVETVLRRREWEAKKQKRMERLDKDLYYTNAEIENRINRDRGKDEKLKQETTAMVWQQVKTEHLTGQEDQKPEWKEATDKLIAAVEEDLKAMEDEKDLLKRFNMERYLFYYLNILPDEYGGESYFESIMKGEEPRTYFERYAEDQNQKKYSSMRDNTKLTGDLAEGTVCKTLAVMGTIAAGQGEEQEALRKYLSKLLYLYGRKMDGGFYERNYHFAYQAEKQEKEARKYQDAFDNRMHSANAYQTYYQLHEDKRVDPQVFADEQSRSEQIAKMKANGWDLPFDEEFLENIFASVAEIQGEMAGVMATFFMELVNTPAVNAESRNAPIRLLDEFFDLCGKTVADPVKKKKALSPARAEELTDLVLIQLNRAPCDIDVLRLRHGGGDPEDPDNMAHEPADFISIAQSNGWWKRDNDMLEATFDLLCKSYERLQHGVDGVVTDEDRSRATEMESIVRTIETTKVDAKTKDALTARIIALFGNEQELLSVERKAFLRDYEK